MYVNDSVVLAPALDDDAIYGIPRPLVPASVSSVANAAPTMGCSTGYLSPGFDVDLLGRVFLKPFQTVKSIPPKLRLGFARVFLQALDAVLTYPSEVSSWIQLLILP